MVDVLLALLTGAHRRVSSRGPERGDVPGWVLITLMTAVIVAGLWAFAETALANILDNALCSIGVRDTGC